MNHNGYSTVRATSGRMIFKSEHVSTALSKNGQARASLKHHIMVTMFLSFARFYHRHQDICIHITWFVWMEGSSHLRIGKNLSIKLYSRYAIKHANQLIETIFDLNNSNSISASFLSPTKTAYSFYWILKCQIQQTFSRRCRINCQGKYLLMSTIASIEIECFCLLSLGDGIKNVFRSWLKKTQQLRIWYKLIAVTEAFRLDGRWCAIVDIVNDKVMPFHIQSAITQNMDVCSVRMRPNWHRTRKPMLFPILMTGWHSRVRVLSSLISYHTILQFPVLTLDVNKMCHIDTDSMLQHRLCFWCCCSLRLRFSSYRFRIWLMFRLKCSYNGNIMDSL